MRPAQVIVGVDGSPHSRLALRWAADEAAHRGAAVRIVHAYGSGGLDEATSPREQADGERIVTAAVDEVRHRTPDVPVTGIAVRAGAAATLLAAARHGDLLTVGHRARSELTALLAGSTCQQVAMHAAASVAIVRGRLELDGPVVVGYDGSAAAPAVLDSAFGAAAARGCGLTVLRAFRPGAPAWPAEAPPPALYNARTTGLAIEEELGHLVAPTAEKYPDVAVEYRAIDGDAAQALADASRRAQLVVVGTRGHGGFAGLLLGSVGLHLTHHADCPVLICR
jgi:nucleotide-binding universal stress UspA family protein